jgi:hypothetical protein
MYLHANAKLGLAGRLALVSAIEGGVSLRGAAAAFSVSPATAHRWWHRWLNGGRNPELIRPGLVGGLVRWRTVLGCCLFCKPSDRFRTSIQTEDKGHPRASGSHRVTNLVAWSAHVQRINPLRPLSAGYPRAWWDSDAERFLGAAARTARTRVQLAARVLTSVGGGISRRDARSDRRVRLGR